MKSIKYILITTLAALAFSCVKLDETLFDQIPGDKFPENERQLAANLLIIYDRLMGYTDWGGYWFLQELTGDGVLAPTRGADWNDGGKWVQLHKHEWTGETEALMQAWKETYQGIAECNKLADGMRNSTDPITLRGYADVRVMRAYYYYCLIDLYGNVPYVTSFVDAPQRPHKNHRANIFDSLINELEWSLQHLPDGKGARAAVNKGMVFSLLAKLYINGEVFTGRNANTHGYWEKAEAYVDSVLAMGYQLDANVRDPFKTNNRNSAENIFVINFDEALVPHFNLHMRTLHYNSDKTFGMGLPPWNGFAIMADLFKSYEETDLRRGDGKGQNGWFLYGQQVTADGADLIDATTQQRVDFTTEIPALVMSAASNGAHTVRNAGVRANKFEVKNGALQNLSNQYPLFRYADILLMKAELRVRRGGNGDEWIKMVRQRADLDGVAKDVASGATLDHILAERGRELVWESYRRQDLIRFGKFGNAWWEKPASDPSRQVFNIPKIQIDTNPNLALDPQ